MKDKALDILIVVGLLFLSISLIGFGNIGTIVTGAIILAWLVLSIKFIGPKYMAVLVIFGASIRFCNSGPHFVPFLPATRLAKFPKKWYNLNYPASTAVTKAGEYKGKEYGTLTVGVDSVAYIRFPRNQNLKEILASDIPIEDKELKDWTEESVVGAIRVSVGIITWEQATEDIDSVRKKANKVFKRSDGPLLQAGFEPDCLMLTVKEVILPPEIEKSLPKVDKQRLEAEAAPFEAEQRAEEIGGAVITMFCKQVGMSREDVQAMIVKSPANFVKKYGVIWDSCWDAVHRRMGIDGKSYFDVRTPDGTSAEGLIALGARMFGKIGPLTEGEKTEDKEEKEEEEAVPKQVQSFWGEKRPMEALHRRR